MSGPSLSWSETLEGLAWTLERPEATRALYVAIEATLTLESLRSPAGPVVIPMRGTLHGVGVADGATLSGRLVARPPGRLVYDGVFSTDSHGSCRMAGEKHFFWLAPVASTTELQLSFYDAADREYARALVRSTFATNLRPLLRSLRLSGIPGLELARDLLLR